MSAVATPARERVDSAPMPPEAATLEAVILGAWEGLVWDGRCACPVCGDEMTAGHGDAGACRACGSEFT